MVERDIRSAVMDIKLTDDMSKRIVNNCYRNLNRKRFSIKRSIVIVAAVLALGATTVASVKSGSFRDVLNWNGAVVGTVYENATEEIKVKADIDGDNLVVVIETENKAPYIYLEEIGITNMYIESSDGKKTYEFEEIVSALNDGTAQFLVDIKDIESEIFNIVIEEFTGYAKAEQPLPVKGVWKISI